MQFCELVQCGMMKLLRFASESIAGAFGIEQVIESAVMLFLGGLQSRK